LASSPDGPASPRRQLPATPNLEQLKKQAKERLRDMREAEAAATLAQAQFALARDYGFASWRALKAAVAQDLDRFTGHYRRDPNVIADSIFTITHKAGRLFIQGVGGRKTPLVAVEPGVFALTDTEETYRFEGDPGRPAQRVVIGEGFKTIEALRTDAGALREAEAALAHALADQSRPRTRVELDPATFVRYVGTYVSPFGAVLEINQERNALFLSDNGQAPIEILPEGADRFFFPGSSTQISFRVRDGHAEALAVHQFGRVIICPRASGKAAMEFVNTVERIAAQESPRTHLILSEERLKRYVGRYALDQNITLTITADGDRLFGALTGRSSAEMFAETEARFLTSEADRISFIEDATGRVDRAVLHQPGFDLVLMRQSPETAISTAHETQGAGRSRDRQDLPDKTIKGGE
jgi:Domain of unknown function (DUF3471)